MKVFVSSLNDSAAKCASEPTPEEVGQVDFVIAKPYTLEGLHASLAALRPR